MRITINGVDVNVISNSLNIDDAIGERSTASFVVKTDITTHFEQGQPVAIYDDNDELIYAGVIDKPSERKPPGTNVIFHSITAKDWHYLADKRVIAKAYENMRAGDIVRDIVGEKLTDEGVIASEEYTWREYEALKWGDL